MVGRIPIVDVMPLVDLGRQPAKATVGEPFPVSGDGLPRGPRQARRRSGADRTRRQPTAPGADDQARDPVDRYLAWVTPDQEGAWTFEVQAWSDPIATWQYAADLKIPAGVDVELMFTEGALLLERVLKRSPPPRSAERKILTAAVAAAKDTKRPVEARLAQLQSRSSTDVLARAPDPRAGHRRGPLPGVRRSRAGAVRQLVRVLPALRGSDPRRSDRQR